jgi:hypothetical protein
MSLRLNVIDSFEAKRRKRWTVMISSNIKFVSREPNSLKTAIPAGNPSVTKVEKSIVSAT